MSHAFVGPTIHRGFARALGSSVDDDERTVAVSTHLHRDGEATEGMKPWERAYLLQAAAETAEKARRRLTLHATLIKIRTRPRVPRSRINRTPRPRETCRTSASSRRGTRAGPARPRADEPALAGWGRA